MLATYEDEARQERDGGVQCFSLRWAQGSIDIFRSRPSRSLLNPRVECPSFCLSVLSEMRAPRGNKHTRVYALSFHFATNKNFLHRVCATPNNSCEELLYARSVSGNKTDVRVTQRSRYAGDRGSHFRQGKGLFYARFAVYDMVEKEAIRIMILNTHFASPALKAQ